MVVELRLPAEVMDALDFDAESATGAERGPFEISVVLDAVGAVSNLVTVAGLLKAAPELARRLRSWAQDRPAASGEHLLVKGPKFSIELDLPPNVPSQKIIDALTQALQAEQGEAE